jgi:NADPH-dependent 7-cyano-7-deazaguanine reductase QueF-like protein
LKKLLKKLEKFIVIYNGTSDVVRKVLVLEAAEMARSLMALGYDSGSAIYEVSSRYRLKQKSVAMVLMAIPYESPLLYESKVLQLIEQKDSKICLKESENQVRRKTMKKLGKIRFSHTSPDKTGSGDFYGTSVRAPVGRLRDSEGKVTRKQKLNRPPRSI